MTKKRNRSEVLKANTAKRHQKIRDLYKKNFTNQQLVNGAKIYTKDYVMAKLAEDFCLSIRQIENIIYSKPKEVALPAPAAPGAEDAGAALASAA